MIRPVTPLLTLVLIVQYFLGSYRLIRLSPYLGLVWTDYWEPWPPFRHPSSSDESKCVVLHILGAMCPFHCPTTSTASGDAIAIESAENP
jgi:hypothetical protein